MKPQGYPVDKLKPDGYHGENRKTQGYPMEYPKYIRRTNHHMPRNNTIETWLAIQK